MEPKVYDVEVVFRQRAIYRVAAEDRESAERLAAEHWQHGKLGELPGHEWCELETVQAAELEDEGGQTEDAEIVLRFLQERERLVIRMAGSLLAPTVNDAISAAQVAADLEWVRRDGAKGPDLLRATRALELLCRTRRAVCFERQRVRSGERGDIRLYCTPSYLEHLTASIEGIERQAV